MHLKGKKTIQREEEKILPLGLKKKDKCFFPGKLPLAANLILQCFRSAKMHQIEK